MGDSGYEGFSGVVSLYEGGRELETLCAGFAERSNRRPNDADTIFGMASGSKIFTAAGVLKLAEEGAFGLDDPVERYIADYRVGEGVTIRQLLAHRSGLADYFDEEAGGDYEDLWRERPCYRMRKPEDFLPLFVGRKPKSAPGERFSYSNAGYVLLAYLVERVALRPFPAFMRETLFEPCGMARTGYYRLDMMPPNAASGYIPLGDSFRSNAYAIPIVGGGDGGAFTNGRDMARFWDALMGGSLLGPEFLGEMLAPREAEAGGRFGVWIGGEADGPAFVQGEDPGVEFLSYHDGRSGRTLTIAANVECSLGPVVRDWKPRLEG
jgi:CubicO group peptidase (beta-lactamase class C family)